MVRRYRYDKLIWLALLAAAVGRGWGLWHRGLMEHDEGHALLNANTWWHVMRWALSGGLWGANGAGTIAELRDTLHQQGGTLYSAGKLGYSLLIAAVGLPGHVSTGLALALAWVAGCAVAALAGGLAWQYSRSKSAVMIAGGGCLTSPLLIDLSREASGTIWALVFGMAGAVAINASVTSGNGRRHWAWGVAGGGLLGYGFSCHFNLAPFILGVYLAATVYAWALGERTSGAWRRALKQLLPAALGGLGMLALFEGGTQLTDYVLRNSYPEFLPFSGELRRLFFRDQAPMLDGILYGDGAIGWGMDAWAIYGHALLREGPAWLCLMAGVFGMLLWQGCSARRRRVTPALVLLAVPALFWAAYVYRVERSLGMCMAASWVLIGVIVGPMVAARNEVEKAEDGNRGVWRVALEILAVMQFAAGGIATVQLAELRSPLPEVVAQTFAAPVAQGKLVTAGSFDVGFAPLWKWAIVEYDRVNVAKNVRVDFARFDSAEIVFVDPSTWRWSNPDFDVTRAQVDAGRIIAAEKNSAPGWTVWSVALGR